MGKCDETPSGQVKGNVDPHYHVEILAKIKPTEPVLWLAKKEVSRNLNLPDSSTRMDLYKKDQLMHLSAHLIRHIEPLYYMGPHVYQFPNTPPKKYITSLLALP